MRPDPYKRAKSRQYKAKHGLIDSKIATKQQFSLPSNITSENILPEGDLDDQSDICLNFDGLDITLDIKEGSHKSEYKYPKELYEKLFNDNYGSIEHKTSQILFSQKLAQKLSLPENYFYENSSKLIVKKDSIDYGDGASKFSRLKLHEGGSDAPPSNNHVQHEKVSKDKLALEDWLDQVL